jgi:hypothetical protein
MLSLIVKPNQLANLSFLNFHLSPLSITGENPATTSDDELAQVLIAVYYPGLSRNSVSFEYLPGLNPVCKSNTIYDNMY